MPQKTAKVLNQAEGAISDDEDEPVSFFTFSDKTESLTDEKAETIQSQDAKSSSGLKVNEPIQEISNHAVTSFLRGKVPSTSPTFQGAAGLTESKQQVMEVPSAQVDFGSEESFSLGELETKTYYYEQQPAQNQQYPGYSANDYVSTKWHIFNAPSLIINIGVPFIPLLPNPHMQKIEEIVEFAKINKFMC